MENFNINNNSNNNSQNIENKIKYYIEDLKENINRINYKYYSQVDIDLLFEDEILNYKLILRKRKKKKKFDME